MIDRLSTQQILTCGWFMRGSNSRINHQQHQRLDYLPHSHGSLFVAQLDREKPSPVFESQKSSEEEEGVDKVGVI